MKAPLPHKTQARSGNLHPLGNRGCLKTLSLCDFEIIFGMFSKCFEKWGLFSTYFENIPPPPGAVAPGGGAPGVLFQNILKTYPNFQNILKIGQSMFSKSPQIRLFKEPSFKQGRKMPCF